MFQFFEIVHGPSISLISTDSVVFLRPSHPKSFTV